VTRRVRWIEVSAEVDGEAVEAVAEAFSRFAHGGVVIEYPTEPGPEIAWNEEPVIARDRPTTVRGYLPLGREGRRRQRRLEEAIWHLSRIWPIGPPTIREVDEADWANAWKDHFHVHRVGERLLIRPTWREFEPGPDDLVIALDPGMAFGTGLHPSTRLCLVALERLVRPGDRVLDVGTGSGILAIAAARLGASLVRAVDLDGVALEAARANVAANGLGEVVQVRHGDAADLPEQGSFDVVVANIIARVIIDSAPSLAGQLRPGGHLIASGILDERRDEVTVALAAHGLSVEGTLAEADWCALLARSAPASRGEGDGDGGGIRPASADAQPRR
jgi:ribosomal protein L11 methyltransferase